MQIAQADQDIYFFWNQDNKEYEYNHRYLVPGTERGDYGMSEKNSGWTKLTAREYAKKHNVNIVKTGKRPA